MARKLYEVGRGVSGWIVANLLGMAAVGALVFVLQFLKSTPGILMASLLVGMPIGLAQWIALRRVASISKLWALTTSTGLLLGLVFLNSPILVQLWESLDGRSVLSLIPGYVVTGFFVGLAQWLLLRHRFIKSWVWLLGSAAGLGLGSGLVLISDLIHQAWLVSIILVALVYAVVTGFVILWWQASRRKTVRNLVNAA